MAGELLFRILDRLAFDTLLQRGKLTTEIANEAFLDRGNWSLTELIGEHYVVLEGSAFSSDAPWLYDEQETFDELPPEDAEFATLSVPPAVVKDWNQRLRALPSDGEVARNSARVRDALLELITRVETSEQLGLTVECLL